MNATLTIPAELDALEQLGEFIQQLTEGRDERLRMQLTLAVHELCMNIIQHAYAGEAGSIQVDAQTDDETIQFIVQDSSEHTYEQATVVAPDPFDLPEHGWGMIILTRVMDSIDYQRLEHGNRWYLTKGWSKS
ncbi:MAG: ATP-binding protein [Anaerolineae bacterium]|nr:ATP-binding protein [Anaerolineae bacterium]